MRDTRLWLLCYLLTTKKFVQDETAVDVCCNLSSVHADLAGKQQGRV